MTKDDLDQEKAGQEQELRIQWQIAFTAGLFQGDVTVHSLVESMAEGVVVINNSGTILLVNSRTEKMFGYDGRELIGKPHAILIPERFRKVHGEHEAHFFQAPRIRPMGQLLELFGLRRDGSEFPLEVSLSLIETVNGTFVLAFVNDITARKQYQARLQESDELFRIQVECVHDSAIFMLDARGDVLNWNKGAERLLDYKAEDIIGSYFSCFYPKEEQNTERLAGLLHKSAAEGQAKDEGWRIRKDGSRFWADVTITVLRDENGNLRGFSNVIRDITGRKQADDALRYSEARYRALYRDNPTMITTLDIEWKMLSVNPFFADQLGYSIDELEGQSVLKIFHEEDCSTVVEQLQSCVQNPNQVHRWKFRKVCKDGRILWVEEIAQAVYDLYGSLTILLVCLDITERRQAEEALRKSELKLSTIFHRVPALIGISTLSDGRFIDVNDVGLRTLGYRREEMIGRTAMELGFWASKSERDTAMRSLEEHGTLRGREITISGKSGQTLTGLYSAELVQFNGERNVLNMVIDITERKQMEEEIKRLNTELEAFNFTVAHDLRKPLTVINGYCQAIQELCGDSLDEQCTAYLQEAYEGTCRMNRLIDSLMNFSRLARVELNREKIDISAIAREVAAELQQGEPDRRVTLIIEDNIVIDGDGELLRVVLDNLLGNAWKYTANQEEAVIEFGMVHTDGKPVCRVRDNGAGFAMAEAEKLFIPFQRLSSTGDFKGHGIGLATVERIIKRHGGRIWAEGEPGKGACFFFTL